MKEVVEVQGEASPVTIKKIIGERCNCREELFEIGAEPVSQNQVTEKQEPVSTRKRFSNHYIFTDPQSHLRVPQSKDHKMWYPW